MPAEHASKVSPTPPWPQKRLRWTQTEITSASVIAFPSLITTTALKEFKCEPPIPVEDDEDDDDDEDYDQDDNFVEDEAREYGREYVGPVASPYLMPNVNKRRFLDTQYGDMFMIGDSQRAVDNSGYITIKYRMFKGSQSPWELLKRKKVSMEFITKDDLKTYKKILMMTKALLTLYPSDGNINITRRKKFRDVIAPFFAKPKIRGVEYALRRKWTMY